LQQDISSIGQATTDITAANAAPELRIAASASPASQIDVEEVFLPQARLPVADDLIESSGTSHIFAAAPVPPNSDAATRPAVTGAMLQEALQAVMQKAGNPARPVSDQEIPLAPVRSADGPPRTPPRDGVTARTTTPPPPFRGALPSAQPVVPPSIVPNTPLTEAVHRLLDDTDAAVARQTLLQVASLPDRADIAGTRTDSAAPRWNFEIPFATPAGTAIAQFEISRETTGRELDAAKRVWRARFSLDVEPMGPIHALISLSGDKTSVRMWAEWPTTATRLRAGASELSQALGRAELQPGDIVICQGAPTQTEPAPAGYFLDRAL
jgi:hypothetical protein